MRTHDAAHARAHTQQRHAAAAIHILNVTDEFLAVGGGPAFLDLVPSTKRNSGAAAGTSHASCRQFLTVSTGSMKSMEDPKPK